MNGLAVTALSLSHFRSHLAAHLAFDGRPVALIGANGAGKTNVLEAVSLLSPGRGLRRATPDEIVRRPEAIGWKVLAEVRGVGGAHEIESRAEDGRPREVRIDGKPAPQSALGRVFRLLWLVPSMDRLWLDAAEGRRRFLDRMVLSFFPEHAEASLTYEKAMRERNRLLKEGVADPRWYGALEAQMAEAGAAIVARRAEALARVVVAQAGTGGAFPRAELAISGEIGDLAAALTVGRRADMAAGRTLVGPHRADLLATYAEKAMPAAQCSTGEQKALLISLILANARALASDIGAAPVLLLDEVAAHLDADRRAALYNEIGALGAQAIMTGTEAHLFDSLGARAQMFRVAEEGGQSRIEEVV